MERRSRDAAHWLAGFVDGEGSIANRPSGKGRQRVREIRITNTDEGLLREACDALNLLGIKWRRSDRSERERLGTKPIFDLVVTGKENLQQFAELVPLRCERKRLALEESLSSYIRLRDPGPAALALLYNDEGLSIREIAVRLGTTYSNVQFWLAKHGIARRPAVRPRRR